MNEGSLDDAIKFYEMAAQQYLLATNDTKDTESFTSLTNLAQQASQKAIELVKRKQQIHQQQHHNNHINIQQQQLKPLLSNNNTATITNPMAIPSNQKQTSTNNYYQTSTPSSTSSSYSPDSSPSRNGVITMNLIPNQTPNLSTNPNPTVIHYAAAGSPPQSNNSIPYYGSHQAAGLIPTTNSRKNSNPTSMNVITNAGLNTIAPSSSIKTTPPATLMQESAGPLVGQRDFFVGEAQTSVKSSVFGRDEIVRMFPPQMRQQSINAATISVEEMRNRDDLKEPSSTNNSDILLTPSSGNNLIESGVSPTEFIWNWMEKLTDLLPRLPSGNNNNNNEQQQISTPISESSLMQSFYLMNTTNKKMRLNFWVVFLFSDFNLFF
jgi:hypothetical protein